MERNLTTGSLRDSMNEMSDVRSIVTENGPKTERSSKASRGIHDIISSYKEVLQ
jgi:hypothetical protein